MLSCLAVDLQEQIKLSEATKKEDTLPTDGENQLHWKNSMSILATMYWMAMCLNMSHRLLFLQQLYPWSTAPIQSTSFRSLTYPRSERSPTAGLLQQSFHIRRRITASFWPLAETSLTTPEMCARLPSTGRRLSSYSIAPSLMKVPVLWRATWRTSTSTHLPSTTSTCACP